MSYTIPLPRLGIDLLSDETQMPKGTVRAAVNVDIDKRGQFARRQGTALVSPGEGYGDLYPWGRMLLARRGSTLVSIDPETLVETDLIGLGSDDPVSFTPYNGHLYIAARHELLMVHAQDGPRKAGVSLPASLPTLSAGTAGALGAGKYTAAISVVDAHGEESPTHVFGQVDAESGLLLTGLAIVPGMRWRIYITPPDGDQLYLAEEFAAVFSQFSVTVSPTGAPCSTLYLAAMPGGHIVRGYNGRLYVANGSTLWFSEPLRPHLVSPRHGFLQFTGRIRMVEPTDSGIYVGDDRGVWWLAGGDPNDFKQQMASDTSPLDGSSIVVPSHHLGAIENRAPGDYVVWMSPDGHMVGTADGTVNPLNSGRIKVAPEVAGQSVFFIRDGVKQIITLTASPGPSAVFGGAIDTNLQ